MTTFPGSPRLVKGGIVLLDPDSGAVLRIITLQYNPDTLTRSLQIKALSEGGDRSEALRLTGPPVETIKLDAEIDASDQLRGAARHSSATGGARNHRLSNEQPDSTERRARAVWDAGDHAVGGAADSVCLE